MCDECHAELEKIFKPDEYGFCQKQKVWFDVVLKVFKVSGVHLHQGG